MHPTAVSDRRSDGYMSLPQDPVVLDASMDGVPPVRLEQLPVGESSITVDTEPRACPL